MGSCSSTKEFEIFILILANCLKTEFGLLDKYADELLSEPLACDY